MSKYKAKLATQKYVEEKIGELALVVSSPDEAVDEGVYKVIDGAGSYILITQTVGEGISPIRQSKITAEGVIYSREFDIFEPPYPEFTQSTVSQNEMALFEIMVDSQFAAMEDELEKSRIVNTAEGESIALPDSDDAQLRGLKVMGKTEQFKTNGYQLFDASRIGSTESAGVKFTNNGDGSFTITKADTNDTDVTTSSFQVAYSYTHEETVAMFKAGKVYIKGDATISPPLSIQERWTVDGTIKSTSAAFINGTKYITITEDELNDPTYHIRFVFYASAGTTITAGTIKPIAYQLKNDTDKFDGTWEPFTGGKPAPCVNNVKSKNLFKLPKDINIVNYGITITGNAGESFVTINGTCDNTQDSSITFVASGDNSLLIKADKKYTASVRGLHKVTSSTDRILINGRKTEGGIYVMANHIMTDKPVTFPSETFPTIGADVLVNIMFIFSPGTTYDNEKVYIQIEEGETATPWMPYFEPYIESYPQPLVSIGDDGGVDVNVHVKNLFDKSMTPVIKTGASAAQLDTGVRVTASSTISNSFVRYDLGIQVVPGKVYTLSAKIKESADNFGCARLGVIDENGNEKKAAYAYANTPTRSIIASDDMAGCVLRLTLYSNNGSSGTPVVGDYVDYTDIQVEISDAPTPYEPYKPIQTLTIPTPNGLPAVPASENGNYTDSSGQQWICDEVDFVKGLYVQRCGKIVYDGTEEWGMHTGTNNETFTNLIPEGKHGGSYKSNLVCSHASIVTSSWDKVENAGKFASSSSVIMQFGYIASKGTYGSKDAWKSYLAEQYANGTPITVIYELAEPIETPLSDEQIAAYKALHTHYPSTSIHNSDNAHMVVDYVADTKNYVDNQIKKEIAELKALVLEV